MSLALGFDNYSIRSLRWKAARLIDYAASLEVDCLMLSDLGVFESTASGYFADLRTQATAHGLRLQVGMLSICPSSVLFDRAAGTAQAQLQRTIDIARALGSPVARCVLGKIDDRFSSGGIQARIAETVSILRDVRPYARDAGIKIAVENHAGDLRSSELVQLIEQAGAEEVGALIDSGNAVWALEEPVENLQVLAPYALSTGIRDSVVWNVPSGAIMQWTAVGEGSVDFKEYFGVLSGLCPQVPVMLEIISGRPNEIPFRQQEFLQAYPAISGAELRRFEERARAGHPRPAFSVAPGINADAAAGEYQQAELARSVYYCREKLGLGNRPG